MLQEIMLCAALALNLEPLPVPEIRISKLPEGVYGQYWAAGDTVFLRHKSRALLAHEFAHKLQIERDGIRPQDKDWLAAIEVEAEMVQEACR